MSKTILANLKEYSDYLLEMGEFHEPTEAEMNFYQRTNTNFISAMYMPHENQYAEVLKLVDKNTVVIDMGSGDFIFPLLLSKKVRKVYALELNPILVSKSLEIIGYKIPSNLIVICSDWFNFPIPDDVKIITCLCNSPKIPDSWYNYKIIIGTTAGIKILEKEHEKKVSRKVQI